MRKVLLLLVVVTFSWVSPAEAVNGGPEIKTFHVAPSGDDRGPGTEDQPFATLEGARNAIRGVKAEGGLPDGGIQVVVHGGVYPVEKTFRLDGEDSGTTQGLIIYRAATGEHPIFSGGILLPAPQPLEDSATPERLPEVVRGKVVVWDLGKLGAGDLIPFELGGFGSGRGFTTHPAMELYLDDQPMTLARWPNEGFVKTVDVTGPLTLDAWDKKRGTREGRFIYEGDRPSRWLSEPDAWLYGYWFWDWADSYEKIASIDVEKQQITLSQPWHTFGYRKDQRYFAINLLSELDAPGEWYLDRASRRLFFYPPKNLAGTRVELSTTAFPMVVMDGVSHVTFEGLQWELGGSDGVKIQGGEGCALVGCTIRKLAGNGIEVLGGARHRIVSCDIHTLGRGGVVLSGGDRKRLEPGGHLLENCHIHHLARIDHTYTPGVLVQGVGQQIRHNLFHHIASSAMRVDGNDHLIELNESHHVVMESDDQGAADMWGSATYRGNVFRYNYWHHLGSGQIGQEKHLGPAGIRLDDAISGVRIEGNVFHRCTEGASEFGGVQIHGGKENVVEGNLFADCRAAVSFTPWGEERWKSFVARALDDPQIDRDVYLRRYPSLENLNDGVDTNTIRGNVAVRCRSLLLRAPDTTVVTGNETLTSGEAFAEGPDGRLIWNPEMAKRYGLGDIPFEKIGLYPDAFRKSRP